MASLGAGPLPSATIARHAQPIPLLFFGGGDETLEDGSKYNPSVISFIRDEWIHKQVQEREAEFTEYRPMRVFVGTWNVNGKWPREDLTAWLTEGADNDAEGRLTLPDVYVIGLQEMVDLTVTNVALGAQSSKRSAQWIGLLDNTLNQAAPSAEDRYVCIGTRFLVGILIAVYAKVKYQRYISDVQDAEAPVGVMGVMGNKGGASVRLKLFDSTFCFVCAHLAAHRNAVAQRNADFASIMAKTEFRDDALAEAAAAAGKTPGATDLGRVGILDHDFVVWFGDFNYRIVETISTERCFELAYGAEAELEQLRKRDQLNIERAAQRSFHGFQEGPLTFRPTYKFQPGTSVYEQRPEKKLRAPAWCDRVLWRTSPGVNPGHFMQLYYGSVDSLVTSDHKPVHAVFEAAVKTIIQDKRAAVVADITRQLDAMENRSMPKVKVSETIISIADVIYMTPVTRIVTIENTGEVAATWRFVPKPEEKYFCKTWMTVEPAYGMIPPGERTDVTITINVDDAVARDISLGRESSLSSLAAGAPAAGATTSQAAAGGLLEDILILRMERGRDYYLAVSATVLPTCFGCSLAQLARRPEPMRALALTNAATLALNASGGAAVGAVTPPPTAPGAPAQAPPGVPDLNAGSKALVQLLNTDDADVADAAHAGPLASSDRSWKGSMLMSVPKEIWRLVDVIFRRGLDTRGIFLAPGDPVDILELRECLDTGDAIPPTVDILSVAQVLLDLLSSLREPVIPCSFFPGTDFRTMPIDAYCAFVLKQLSPLHYNTFVYLIRFIREVLAHAATNGTSADAIAFVFSRCLMRKIPHDEAPAHWQDAATEERVADAASQAGSRAVTSGEEEEGSPAVGILSGFADKGTRWEPTREEQESMTRMVAFFLTSAHLA